MRSPIAFIGNAGYAPVLIFLNERFPTALRASGTGLSWNIGFALGGMMPTFVSLVSGSPAEIPMSLAYFAVGVFVVYLDRGDRDPRDQGQLPLIPASARPCRGRAGFIECTTRREWMGCISTM